MNSKFGAWIINRWSSLDVQNFREGAGQGWGGNDEFFWLGFGSQVKSREQLNFISGVQMIWILDRDFQHIYEDMATEAMETDVVKEHI